MFRALIPIDRLMADDAVRPLWENEASGFVQSPPGEKFIMTYPCRSGTLMNLVVFHRTLPHLESDGKCIGQCSKV
jgi:hypothetical protein